MTLDFEIEILGTFSKPDYDRFIDDIAVLQRIGIATRQYPPAARAQITTDITDHIITYNFRVLEETKELKKSTFTSKPGMSLRKQYATDMH